MSRKKSLSEWIDEYEASHRHPVNRVCHAIGIPTVIVSTLMLVLSFLFPKLFLPGLALFIAAWAAQIVGHRFEGKAPKFTQDWRFFFVCVAWWISSLRKK